jgi:hypothetical protein
MKEGKTGLLFFANGGMELSWRYGWAAFITAAIFQRPFPLPEAAVTFGLAAGLILISLERGWRVIWILGLQVLGLTLAALRMIYAFNFRSYPFFGREWIMDFFTGPRTHMEGFLLVLILFWTLFFWIGGVTFARRSTAYLTISSRFDLGAGAFFLLLLAGLVLRVRGGLEVQGVKTEFLVLTFFIFGLLAMGLGRSRGDARRSYLSGYRNLGVLLGFSTVIVLLGTGLFLLFLPYLTLAAETGYRVIKSVAEPLTPVLIAVLRFLLVSGRVRPAGPAGGTGGKDEFLIPPVERSWWAELLEKFMGWGLVGLTVLVVALSAGLGLWALTRWLLSRTPGGERKTDSRNLFAFWVAGLRAFLLFCREKAIWGLKGARRAVQIYSLLLRWGRHSGIPPFPTETPTEYGVRLKHRFPVVRKEIEVIIEAFNEEVYGERVLSAKRLKPAQLAWGRLRSPLHWPARLRSWFFSPTGYINPASPPNP